MTTEPHEPANAAVLVVIADPQLRQLVAWLLDDLALARVDVSNWGRAVATTDTRPALVIGDPVRAFIRARLRHAVPSILRSYRGDGAAIAAGWGAAAGLRKPLNIGMLMATVRRILPRVVATRTPSPEAEYPEEPTPRG